MNGQIIPRIYSANKRLLFSETICFFPKDGLSLKLPSSDIPASNELTFLFCFTDNDEKKNSYTTETIDNKTLKFTFENFGSTLGMGLTTPISLTIGNKSYELLMYAHRLEDQSSRDKQLLHMTITMYGDIN